MGTPALQGSSGAELGTVWSGAAAERAQSDLGRLARRGMEMARGLEAAAAVLGRYADALDRAEDVAARLGGERTEALAAHGVAVARVKVAHVASPATLAAALGRLEDIRRERLASVDRRLAGAREELEQAGRRCAAGLGAAQAQAGMVQGPLVAAGDLRSWVLADLQTVAHVEHLQRLAAHAATALTAPTLTDVGRVQVLRRYAQWAGDPVFATMLLQQLGPERTLEMAFPVALSGASDSLETPGVDTLAKPGGPVRARLLWARLLQAGLSDAAVSVPPEWATALLDRLRSSPDTLFRFAALTRDHGPSTKAFVLPYAELVLAADRSGAFYATPKQVRTSVLDAIDPMVSVMRALQRSPDAARDFFHADGHAVTAGTSERLAYLFRDRVWGRGAVQHGMRETFAAVASLVEVAPREPRAVALAPLVVRLLGTKHPQTGQLPPIRDEVKEPIARILAPYVFDLAFSVPPKVGSELTTPAPGATPDAPDTVTARFDAVARTVLLNSLGRSPQAYEVLFTSARALQNELYLNMITETGTVAGTSHEPIRLLQALRVGADAEIAERSDEADAEYNDAIDAATGAVASLLGTGTALIPGGKTAADAVAASLLQTALGAGIDGATGAVADILHRDTSAIAGHEAMTSRQAEFEALKMDALSIEWALAQHDPQEIEDARFGALFVDGDPTRPRPLGWILDNEPSAWGQFQSSRFVPRYSTIQRELDQTYNRDQPTPVAH